MATKREIDKLINAIPEQVAAAHHAVRNVGVREKEDDTGPGEFAGNPIDPADYGFDMFGCEGETYIRERSKEIARASLKVHGLEPTPLEDRSGVMDGSDFGKAKKKSGLGEITPLSEKVMSEEVIQGQEED